MTTLRDSIAALADTFARSLVDAVRKAAREELLTGLEHPEPARRPTEPSPRSGSLPRAKRTRATRSARKGSSANVAIVIEQIVAVLQKHPTGLRAERLRTELALEPKEMAGPIASALSNEQIGKRGANRGTVYFLLPKSTGKEDRNGSKAPEERTPAPADPKASPAPKTAGKKRRGAYVVLSEAGKAAERGETPDETKPAQQ